MSNKIKICNNPYSGKDFPIFQNYPFELDDFQKYAIQAIEEKENVLVMAGTGSGKTLCAEYAIEKSIQLGKKVIYTSPIKSLSNQKFNEFNRKWPGDRVGILTGDIKFNPDAQILNQSIAASSEQKSPGSVIVASGVSNTSIEILSLPVHPASVIS